MRFGKTFAAYQLARKMKAKRVLVVTFKPAVEDAWQTDVENHVDFEGWQYMSRASGSNPTKVKSAKPFVYFGSLQDLLGKDRSGKIKLKNEKLFQKFGKIGGKVSIARCFTFVGEFLPRKSQYAAGDFIKSIFNNQNLNIKADQQVIRSYMYEEDLVRWLLKIINYSNKNCPIYNVGSDNAISISKLANLLSRKYNLNVNLNSKKISKKKFDKYIPNIQKAKKELNLNINYSALSAIIKTIDILKKNEKVN
jgi:nucleoside-diphosphate-sugar epimerase